MAASAPAVPGRIFISYRREETAYPAGWLFDRLADHFGGGQVFKDVDSIEPGDDFVEVITRAVGSCDVLLALIGEEWLTIADAHGRRRLDNPEDFVRLEIEAALARRARDPDPGGRGEDAHGRGAAGQPRPAGATAGVGAQPQPLRLRSRPAAAGAGPDPQRGAGATAAARARAGRRRAAHAAQPRARPAPGGLPGSPVRRTPPDGRQPRRQPVGVAVEVTGAPDLAVEVTPSALPVEAGGSAAATLRVRPRRRLVAGRSRRHRFRAVSRVAGMPVAAAEGAMLQRPLAPWWVLAAVLLVVLLPVAALLRPQPSLAVPDPAGAPVAEATALLERTGLRAEVAREPSETVAPGRLIRTVPSPGARVRRGDRVTLVVSSGPAVTPLPQGMGELVIGFVDWFAAARDHPGSLLKGL